MGKVIKVLEVFDSLEISGGVQGVVMNIFRKIDHDSVQIDFAVYDAPVQNSYQPEIERGNSRVIPVKNLSAAGPVQFYIQFRNIFQHQKYDVVHAHNIHHNGLILLAAKRCGVPIRISHSHQAFDERNESMFRKCFSQVLKCLNNIVSTRRVACSDLAGKFLYGKHANFEIIPNAVDISRFCLTEDKYELRHQYGYKDDDQYVMVHIGRFSPQKNQLFLIEIMKHFRDTNCILLIAGEGPLKEEFLDAVVSEELEQKICYIGLREDIPQLLRIADCMLLPSIYEGLPVVAVEAQAAGCYSLLSDKITRQADLGVGLVDYLSIENAQLWADRIKKQMKKEVSISLETLHQKIREQRFDTETNLKAWYELYGENF